MDKKSQKNKNIISKLPTHSELVFCEKNQAFSGMVGGPRIGRSNSTESYFSPRGKKKILFKKIYGKGAPKRPHVTSTWHRWLAPVVSGGSRLAAGKIFRQISWTPTEAMKFNYPKIVV
jgi:hypothetical protein